MFCTFYTVKITPPHVAAAFVYFVYFVVNKANELRGGGLSPMCQNQSAFSRGRTPFFCNASSRWR